MTLQRDTRIVVAGEALIDLLVGDDPRHPTAHPGGSPANTAIALARLGTPVGFAGRFGDDVFGDLLLANLMADGVDVGLAVEAMEPASLALVTRATDGAVCYSFHVAGTADWFWSEGELPERLPGSVRAVHTGSLAVALMPGAAALTSWFGRQREWCTTSLDVNIRAGLVGDREEFLPRLENLIATSDIVKASAEDLAWAAPGEDPIAVAVRWQRELGPTLIIVTVGGGGAVAVHDGRVLRRPAFPVAVTDTVGAGDTFSAGLLHRLDEHDLLDRDRLRRIGADELAAALDYASAAAALACTRAGADPPRSSEVEAFIRQSGRRLAAH
jgi:fructokinase